MGQWLSVPVLRRRQILVAFLWTQNVPSLPIQELSPGRDNIRIDEAAAEDMVLCHLVGDCSKDRRECAKSPEESRSR